MCITFIWVNFSHQDMQVNSRKFMELHKYSSYSSPLYFLPESINTLRLQLADGSRREITHPSLGRDFVSGRLEDAKSQGFFRRSNLSSVEFLFDESIALPELLFTRKTIGEQLLEIQFPAEVRICYREPSIRPQKVISVGLFRGFLVTDFHHNPAIPLSALSTLEIKCV